MYWHTILLENAHPVAQNSNILHVNFDTEFQEVDIGTSESGHCDTRPFSLKGHFYNVKLMSSLRSVVQVVMALFIIFSYLKYQDELCQKF